jgi:hypothetical protein
LINKIFSYCKCIKHILGRIWLYFIKQQNLFVNVPNLMKHGITKFSTWNVKDAPNALNVSKFHVFGVLPDLFLFHLLGNQNLLFHFQQEFALSHWQNQPPYSNKNWIVINSLITSMVLSMQLLTVSSHIRSGKEGYSKNLGNSYKTNSVSLQECRRTMADQTCIIGSYIAQHIFLIYLWF